MKAFLGLGANLGDRKNTITNAIGKLQNHPEINILKQSSIIETDPYGNENQPRFLNCVIKVQTDLNPEHLLEVCNAIENELGRIRMGKWGPRTIDIDILFIDDMVIHSHDLVVPHQEVHLRKFVLDSLEEIEPEFVHPVLKKTVKEINNNLL